LITEALLHFPGIGPARLARLQERGIRQWSDVVQRAAELPERLREPLTQEADRCLAAHARRDIGYLAQALHPKDKWRVLHEYFDETSFFDIETSGLEYDASITVIACWHRGAVQTFVAGDGLDRFLDVLDDVKLLASFNGNAFDVPRLLDAFHIPRLPCPHLDLRWPCYHQGYHGGLKQIARQAGLARPLDLQHADGAWAVQLWNAWRRTADRSSLDELLRYCASDALLLRLLAKRLTGGVDGQEIARVWDSLPARERAAPAAGAGGVVPTILPGSFGAGSPARPRALRRWR
jgi:uncharacterized protein YprB with RNaseH-like and TPR domain